VGNLRWLSGRGDLGKGANGGLEMLAGTAEGISNAGGGFERKEPGMAKGHKSVVRVGGCARGACDLVGIIGWMSDKSKSNMCTKLTVPSLGWAGVNAPALW